MHCELFHFCLCRANLQCVWSGHWSGRGVRGRGSLGVSSCRLLQCRLRYLKCRGAVVGDRTPAPEGRCYTVAVYVTDGRRLWCRCSVQADGQAARLRADGRSACNGLNPIPTADPASPLRRRRCHEHSRPGLIVRLWLTHRLHCEYCGF